MLSTKTQLRLADFIKALADLEAAVEVTRNILAEKKGFEPQTAFDHLDVSGRNFISVSDLTNFLNEFGIYPLEEEVTNLLLNYNVNEDLRLTLSDFEDMVLPVTNSYLRQLAISRGAYKLQGLSQTSAWALARVLEREIVENRKIEILRQSLENIEDWDITEAFFLVDSKEQGYLTTFRILEYLRSNDIVASYEDALAFLRRADKDEDGKVSYREFVKILQPGTQRRSQIDPSMGKRPNYEYIDSPSSKKESTFSYKSVAQSGSKTYQSKAFDSKWQLTDQQYGEYLDSSSKDPVHGGRIASKSSYNQDKAYRSWPSESYSGYKSSTDVYSSYSSHKQNSGREEKRYQKSQNSSKHIPYSLKYAQPQNKQSNILIDEEYTPKGSEERISKKPESAIKNEYDISRHRAEHSNVSASKSKGPQKFQQESQGITRKLEFEEKPLYSAKKRSQGSENQKDLSGNQTNQRRESQLGEKNKNSEEVSYSTRRKGPAQNAVSPRKDESPGKHLSAKTLSDKSSIKGYEEEFLVKSIKTILEYERELQILKSDLALKKDFSIITSFRKVINEACEDSTNKTQFEENLKKLGVFFTQTEVDTVFPKIDRDGDGMISLRDYEHLLVPANREHARVLREKDVREELSDRTLKLVISFVKKFAVIESQIEDLKVRMSKRFSMEDAFKAIDTNEKGFIDSRELKEILEYHGVVSTEKDLQNIINKFDDDHDGKLSAQEFTKSFSPQKGSKQVKSEERDQKEEKQEDKEKQEKGEKNHSPPKSETQKQADSKDMPESKEKIENPHQTEEKILESDQKEISEEPVMNKANENSKKGNAQEKELEQAEKSEGNSQPIIQDDPKPDSQIIHSQDQEENKIDGQDKDHHEDSKEQSEIRTGVETQILNKTQEEQILKDDSSANNKTTEPNENP